jgi:two-component system, cell cycle response regulator
MAHRVMKLNFWRVLAVSAVRQAKMSKSQDAAPKPKILLADDDTASRLTLLRWLEGWGYNVTTAVDGQAALKALADDSEIRLAMLDWIMPKHDGVDVCRMIRSGPSEPYVYVVLLTARDKREDIVAGLEAGADDYLVKPCHPLELEMRLRAGCRVVNLQEQLVKAREALRYEAMHDALTGLLNRGALVTLLDRELARSKRSGEPVTIVLGDIDHFKTINDTHGHAVGDVVLREAAGRMKNGIRPYDALGRVGGEEFLLVLPNCDSRAGMAVASRLRIRIAAAPIAHETGPPVQVTLSLGVASTDQFSGATKEQLLRAADAAMYRAKRAGRNRVLVATPEEWESGLAI